jgi:hypothetical protein
LHNRKLGEQAERGGSMSKLGDGTARERDKPWIFRTYAGHSAAHDSNALHRKNLASGRSGPSIAFGSPNPPHARWSPVLPSANSVAASVNAAIISLYDWSGWLIACYVNDRGRRMNADARALTSVSHDDVIEIRYNTKLAVVAIGATGVLVAVTAIFSNGWFDVGLGLLILVLLAYKSYRFLDRSPVVILDADGVRDRRLGSAPIPWSQIRRARWTEQFADGLFSGVTLELGKRNEQLGQVFTREIYVDLVITDSSPFMFIDHVHRFAPNVQVDQKSV